MGETKDKQARYREKLRRDFFRASVPGAQQRLAGDASSAPARPDGGRQLPTGLSDKEIRENVEREVKAQLKESLPDSPVSRSELEEYLKEWAKAERQQQQAAGSVPRSTPTGGASAVSNSSAEAKDAKPPTQPSSGDAEPAAPTKKATRTRPKLQHTSSGRRREEPARCVVDGGEYYRGATEGDVVDVWREMRRQFGTNTQNKLRARTAMRDWLQKKRNVSPDSVIWYGDFVAIRSCEARTRQPEEAQFEDGWFLAVDPNRAGYRDSHIFIEAFETGDALQPGAVDDLVRPAWISEQVRQAEAERLGKGKSRPFVPGTVDELSSDSFVPGEVR